MKTEFRDEKQVEIVVRSSVHPFRRHGACLVRVHPRSGTRVVALGQGTVRAALTPAEATILANAMNRVFPSLRITPPPLSTTDNALGYVPGKDARPFLVALGGRDARVKVGVELAGSAEHPVLEFQPQANSHVRWTATSVSWMPTWTEARILCAEFEQVAAATASACNDPVEPGRTNTGTTTRVS